MTKTTYKDLTLYRRLLSEARPYWLHIAGIFFLSLLATPISLLGPLPLKIAVDSAIGSERLPGFLEMLMPTSTRSNASALILSVGLLVGISLLRHLYNLGSSSFNTYAGGKIALDFRAKIFGHVQRLSLLYHDAKGTADSSYRVMYDATAITDIAVYGLTPFIASIFTFVSMLYIILLLDWQLALVALTVSPVLIFLTIFYRERLRPKWREIKKLDSTAYSVIQEVLTSLRVVKAFGQENCEQERYVRHASQKFWALFNVQFAQQCFNILIGLTTTIGTAAVLYLGVRHVQMKILTLGDLLIIMAYIAQLYGPLYTISQKIGSLQSQFVGAERVISLLDEETDVFEKPDAIPIHRSLGAVTFRDVSFAYNENNPVLSSISFDIPAGTRVGIAGRTGAGKTTLMNLLPRFFDPNSGQILLDGTDLRDFKLADLRMQFAIVLQEPVLFSTTIAENIAYSQPNAKKEKIIQAAKAANAHEFIMNLPDNYDTLVGERGMSLSGGERQRIALARAFLKDAPILILDEPTSSVDMKTEYVILEAMERLMKGRTSFMIAHRLTTLENCDMLLVIQDGKLIDIISDVAKFINESLVAEKFRSSVL